jgi:endonuclease/exonuclease/phosphatase family metal-dependent hydrolase
MFKLFLSLFILPFILFGAQFKVASYNVENLFDTHKSGFEYDEYVPNAKSGWNEHMLSIKIKNIAKVIKVLDADIIALHEVENKEVLKRLNLALGSKKYPYMYTSFNSHRINSVLLSRFPIKSSSTHSLTKRFRPIHKVVLEIEKKPLTLFINHWPSYKHGNKKRLEYAKALEKLYKNEKDFILLGDFNSPFLVNSKGWGGAAAYVSKDNYNLWLEEPFNKRYSYAFFTRRSALDHIIISKSILNDETNFSYVTSSFHHFAPPYLIDKYKNPKRWQISKKGKGKHKGIGYSDHLPIVATFSTAPNKPITFQQVSIKKLYETKETRVNFILKDVMVIDKSKYGVRIEDKNGESIYVYRPDDDLSVGEIYTLHVRELADYKGNREIILEKRIR